MTRNSDPQKQIPSLDADSQRFLAQISEQASTKANRVSGVRTVAVVLSAAGMPFDVEALRQKILTAYPESAVFFLNTTGTPLGAQPPEHVDLLIDMTGPGTRQSIFFAKRLRRMARVAVGRKFGLFRARLYDRVYDESNGATKGASHELPHARQDRERIVQRNLLELAGIPLGGTGDMLPDRGRITPRELPTLEAYSALLKK